MMWPAGSPVYEPAGTPLAAAREHHSGGQTVRVLAGTGRRIAAGLFSGLAFLLVACGVFVLAYLVMRVNPALVFVLVLSWLVLGAFCSVYPVGRWGCGFGEWVVGIRIVRFEDGVTPPGFRRALTRRAGYRRGLRLPSASWFRDADYRRGFKDHRAGTVVVRVQAPPDVSWPDGWERREARRRGVVGFLAVAVIVALVSVVAVKGYQANSGPPFTVGEFYGDGRVWTSTHDGETVTLNRTGGKVFDSPGGCAGAAITGAAAGTLRSLRCEGRLRADFSTQDGTAHLTGQILRFDKASDAGAAAHQLQAPDVVPRVTKGWLHGELIDSEDHYVVVTSVVLPPGNDAATKRAQTALAHLHATALNVIVIDTM